MEKATTPLRYPGGKAKALKKILPLIPEDFSEYREPFLGGGSMFVACRQQHPNALFRINDLNRDVYCFWSALRKNPNELIDAIVKIKKVCKDGRNLYEKLSKSEASGIFGRALRYYVLNRITYSGIVDSGGYSSESFERRFTSSGIENLRLLAQLLKGVKITNASYECLLSEEGKDVFIFLDPPYWSTREFPLYGRNGNLNRFFNHSEFARRVKNCKHKWLITCDDSDLMREMFSFANIYPWEMSYNGLHKKKAIRGKELFITNYEPEHSVIGTQRITSPEASCGTLLNYAS
jgi:DNA adenine methylase